VILPHKIATLLYCFNERDDVLLMERAQEPNFGFWSPPGGKLHVSEGESPHACACREAFEELGLRISPREVHLVGIISEQGYHGHSHWLMFLFEVTKKLADCPPACSEGDFRFFSKNEVTGLKMPETDREQIWPLFWKHRGGFFAATCIASEKGNRWILEESRNGTADY
jgi:8-oxo-dGTP diphosphatase